MVIFQRKLVVISGKTCCQSKWNGIVCPVYRIPSDHAQLASKHVKSEKPMPCRFTFVINSTFFSHLFPIVIDSLLKVINTTYGIQTDIRITFMYHYRVANRQSSMLATFYFSLDYSEQIDCVNYTYLSKYNHFLDWRYTIYISKYILTLYMYM